MTDIADLRRERDAKRAQLNLLEEKIRRIEEPPVWLPDVLRGAVFRLSVEYDSDTQLPRVSMTTYATPEVVVSDEEKHALYSGVNLAPGDHLYLSYGNDGFRVTAVRAPEDDDLVAYVRACVARLTKYMPTAKFLVVWPRLTETRFKCDKLIERLAAEFHE